MQVARGTDSYIWRLARANRLKMAAAQARLDELTGDLPVPGAPARTGVRIEVSDTGSGIAPEDLPHVFDRFWRAEKSRSRQTGGSGLGPSIVRKLIEAKGGTVEARSTPGAGSTFTLRLPRLPPPQR
jgi:two-component system sensor histidine kinase BaeS